MEQASIVGSIRQNKAFKQRVSYWKAKGLSADEAHRRAGDTPRIALAPQPADQVSCHLISDGRKPGRTKPCIVPPPGAIFQRGDPAPKAMSPMAPPPAGPTETVSSRPFVTSENRPMETCLAAEAFYLAVCSIVVVGASVILVRSSAAVFGFSWEGWLKAILLEIGIVGLSVYRASTLAEFLVARGGALLLGALSLHVLHTAVRNDAAAELTTAEASSAEVRELQMERAQFIQVLEALPAQHLTRRQLVLKQLTDNSSRLQGARERSTRSQTMQAVERRYDVEAFARLALMFLNIVFAHGLKSHLLRRRILSAHRKEAPAT